MQPSRRSRPASLLTGLLAIALLAILAVPAAGVAGAAHGKRVAKTEEASDGSTVLANLRGRTLYSLSVEKHGKFICTAGCLSVWHPLLVPAGTKPKGPVALGTVTRPEGKTQVTYRGRPLYSFAEDSKPGETNGEGIRDVGTWHAAVTAPAGDPQTTEPEPEPANPYPTSPTAPTPPGGEAPKSPPGEPPAEYPPYNY
jgi:predicted lipoprotein with Yx(FWY)xxD motif